MTLKRTTPHSGGPTYIILGDPHLREDTPVCRTDDFIAAIWRKVSFIANLQKKHNSIVVCPGDLFDHWKPSLQLVRQAILNLPDRLCTVYGQHDLPQHNIKLSNKCGIDVLEAAGKLVVLPECHWKQEPEKGSMVTPITGKKVLVWHKYNYQGKKPWPGNTDPMAASLLRKYSDFDLIITGDNHKTFFEEYTRTDGHRTILVNPGSMLRMDADQVDHKPCIFLYYEETHSIEQVFLPFEDGVVSREHIEKIKERDARFEAFINRLTTDEVISLNYEENIELFFSSNSVRKSVKEIIYECLENVTN